MSSLIPGWPAFLRKPCTSWLIPKSIFSQHFFYPVIQSYQHTCALSRSPSHTNMDTHTLSLRRGSSVVTYLAGCLYVARIWELFSLDQAAAGTQEYPVLTPSPFLLLLLSLLSLHPIPTSAPSHSLNASLLSLSLTLCLFLFLPLSGLFLSPDCLIFLSPSFSVPQIFYLTLKTLVYNYFPWWVPCARPGYLVTFPLPLPNMLSVSPCLAGSV